MCRWILLAVLTTTSSSFAQDLNIDNLSLEDLINMKTSVASKTETTTRGAAGSVTVITKEEIKQLGARDLIDVLMMVPGLNFAHDVLGVVGLTVRGSWASEGKFSLMVDGQEINDILYSNVHFGNHFPVDQIKRIEIIRGPGSAIYGGYAELAVINITTDSGADIKGARTAVTYGQMREDYGRRNLSVQFGKKFTDWDFSLAGFIGQGRRGDDSFTGYESNQSAPPNYSHETYNYSDGHANDLNPAWLNFGAQSEKWDIRLIYDNYTTTSRAYYGFGNNQPEGIKTAFRSLLSSVQYHWNASENWKITPYLQVRIQEPWNTTNTQILSVSDAVTFDVTSQRSKVGTMANYTWSPSTNILLGAEVYKDQARINDQRDNTGTAIPFNLTGNNDVDFTGMAAYSQLETKFDSILVTLGGRHEMLSAPHGRNISKTVPRLAITKTAEKWHVKTLASQAFRMPSIFNFDVDYGSNGASLIKPETTTTYELEAGYSLSKKSYVTLNLFTTEIRDVIIFEVDGMGSDVYNNYPKVQTNGLEAEYRYKSNSGFTTMNYSFYQKVENSVGTYDVPGRKELLGIPQHKLTFLKSMPTAIPRLQVNPSFVYMWSMSSYEYDIASDSEVLRKMSPVFLANLYFVYDRFLLENMNLGFGVFNMFDEEHRFIQPYNGNWGNSPAPSREYVVRLTYSAYF